MELNLHQKYKLLPPHSTVLLQYLLPLSASASTSAFDLVRIRSQLRRPHSNFRPHPHLLSASTSAFALSFDLRIRPRPPQVCSQLRPPHSTSSSASTSSAFSLSFDLVRFRSQLRRLHSTSASTSAFYFALSFDVRILQQLQPLSLCRLSHLQPPLSKQLRPLQISSLFLITP